MKSFLVCLLAVVYVSYASADCHQSLKCYEAKVNKLLNDQISVELKGQYTYLYLSNIFMRNDLYYPKAAKYFREKSNEELQHAERFIEYQNQRGGRFDISAVTRKSNGACSSIQSLRSGFACAKELEIEVTAALTQLYNDVNNVQQAENCPDIEPESRRNLVLAQPIVVTHPGGTDHINGLDCTNQMEFSKVEYIEVAEMITHEFLGHQIEDTKELANFEATLAGFSTENEKLGSFLADKHFDL